MAEAQKLCKIDHRIIWAIFIVLQAFLIAVMVGTLSTTKWVELNPDLVPSLSFKGSLIRVESGLTKVTNVLSPTTFFDLEHATYEKVGCGACFIVDLLNEKSTPKQTWDFYNSWCKMFKRLWFGAGLFIVFEVLSLVCIAILIVLMILLIANKFYFRATFCAGGCMWASHYVAILGWIAVANVTFRDNCNDLTDGNKPPKICARDAPTLAIFALIFIPFVMVPFFVLLGLLKRNTTLLISQEIEESVNNATEMQTSRTHRKDGKQ